MIIRKEQIKGSDKEICEDVIVMKTRGENFHFIGLADGQSKKTYCREGALEILSSVEKYMWRQNLESYADRSLKEERRELMKCIEEKLESLAQKSGSDKKEFSSTLCTLALDEKNDSFVFTHLGSDCIFGVTEEDKIRILCPADVGITRYHTYLTTSSNAESNLKIGYGKLKRNYKAIYMISEGNSIYRSGLNLQMKRWMRNQQFDEMVSYIKAKTPRDDISVLMILP